MSKFSRDAINRRAQESGIDAPHGPVGEQTMRHFYGASGYVAKCGSDISEIKIAIDRANREMYERVNKREWSEAIDASYRLEDLALAAKLECQRLEREARK